MKKLISIINTIAVVAALILVYPEISMSQTPAPQDLTQDEVKRLSDSADAFKSIAKVSELPGGLNKTFGEMADPGKPFNSGCVRTPDLPSQSLKFAAATSDRLWISYQSGGFCLMNKLELHEISDNKNKLLWSTITPQPMASIKDISEFLKRTNSKKN